MKTIDGKSGIVKDERAAQAPHPLIRIHPRPYGYGFANRHIIWKWLYLTQATSSTPFAKMFLYGA